MLSTRQTSLPRALRPIVLGLTLLGATISRAHAQANLLVNGDAEAGAITGWTVAAGQGFTVSSTPAFVHSGAFSFHPGQFGPQGVWAHELIQDVDLSSMASAIDAGTVTSVFSGFGRSNDAAGVVDAGSLVLEFRDVGANVLANYATGTFTPYNIWISLNDTRVIPAGTRTVRVRLLGQRTVGLSTDCFFDDLVLNVNCGANTYCTAKTNSLGCVPAINVTGAASLTSSSLVVGATQVINNKTGLLFWGQAAAAAPFQGGTLCIAPPTVRTPVQASGGSGSGNDCTGSYVFAFSSSYLAAAGLVPDDDVYCQFWSRDPASASTTGLTDAAHFRVCP